MTLREFFKSQQVDIKSIKACECQTATYQLDKPNDEDILRALGTKVQYLYCPKPVTLSTTEGITVSDQIITLSQRLTGKIMAHIGDDKFHLLDEGEINSYTTDEGKVGLCAICRCVRIPSSLFTF